MSWQVEEARRSWAVPRQWAAGRQRELSVCLSACYLAVSGQTGAAGLQVQVQVQQQVQPQVQLQSQVAVASRSCPGCSLTGWLTGKLGGLEWRWNLLATEESRP